jgi:hypothetical protein
MEDLIKTLIEKHETAVSEMTKFTEKGVAASGSRARKALGEIGKLTKELRKAIQEVKNSKKSA